MTSESQPLVRKAVVISEQLLFRRTYSKLLSVIDSTMSVHTLTETEFLQLSSDAQALPSPEQGITLLDAGGKHSDDLTQFLLAALDREPSAWLIAVLDETDDALAQAALDIGALGVMVKAAPPQVLIQSLEQALAGQRIRPTPTRNLSSEELPESIRKQLSARQQKLVRLMMGGHSITATGEKLGLTPAKVVVEMRAAMGTIKGKTF